MDSLKCPKCNASYGESKKFCGKCGVPLVTETSVSDVHVPESLEDQEATKQKTSATIPPNKIALKFGIGIVVFIIAISGYVGYDQMVVKKKSTKITVQDSTMITVPIGSVSDIMLLFDDKEETSWCVDLRKNPTPAFDFSFKKPMVITGIRAIPGYKKFNKIDRYIQNHKPRQITLAYDGQSRKDSVSFDLASNYSSLGWQSKQLDNPVTTNRVTVQIVDTYPGQNQGSKAKANDVCISEFHFIGYPEK